MPGMRTSSEIELLLPLSRDDPEPLHHQLERGLRDAIRSGRLAAEAAVPSSRALARQVGVSRGIVVESYQQLVAEGYLVSRPGGVTRVARTAVGTAARPPETAVTGYAFDFRPARPDLSEFPRSAWLRSIRRVLDRAPSDRLGYLDGRGVPELRSAIAGYLNRVRGTVADPADIVICSGFAQGIRLVAQALVAAGARQMAVEDPSDPEYRDTIRAAGLRTDRNPGRRGRDPGRPPGRRRRRCRAGHGRAPISDRSRPAPDRRAALAAWATGRGGLIVEDDYDAEFRYDREPIGAIQGLCPDRVVYAGSASKILAPGLRLGWLVAPTWLGSAIAAAKVISDLGSPALEQLTFADFVERGELRPPPPSDATDLPAASRRAARRARASPADLDRSGRRPGSTSLPGCRPTWTRRRSWDARWRPASACPGSLPAGSIRPDRAGSSSATG